MSVFFHYDFNIFFIEKKEKLQKKIDAINGNL
jgi:hypothetical protein